MADYEGVWGGGQGVGVQGDGGAEQTDGVFYEGFADGAEVPIDGRGDGPTPVVAQHQAGARAGDDEGACILTRFMVLNASVLLEAKVVALVCAHMRAVFREHRKALEGNVDYCRRSRDPPVAHHVNIV